MEKQSMNQEEYIAKIKELIVLEKKITLIDAQLIIWGISLLALMTVFITWHLR